MLNRKINVFLILIFLSLNRLTAEGAVEPSAQETKEFQQEMSSIRSLRQSLSSPPDLEAYQKDPAEYLKQLRVLRKKNDLAAYEQFADGILSKWATRMPAYYGRIALELCKPLSSGAFEDGRRFDLAREYALSVLEKSDEIPLAVELELTGHVMTHPGRRHSPQGQEIAERRRKDIEVRLHAWKRLQNAIDPAWDPNEVSSISPDPPRGVPMGISGMSPEAIEDPVLRVEYEASLEAHHRKLRNSVEQRQWRDWVGRYVTLLETCLPYLYSSPPYDSEELHQVLDAFALDEAVKARIRDKVAKNIEAQLQVRSPD